MKLDNLPVGTIDWPKFSSSTNLGKSGTATTRVRDLGKVQVRLVDYSPKYLADHWCSKSHIMFVISGRVVIEHQGGPKFTLSSGMTYHVGEDSGAPHRISSRSGASLFIVDLCDH